MLMYPDPSTTTTAVNLDALTGRIHDLADDVGRLRRRSDMPAYIFDRMADAVESLDVMTAPCAADYVREGVPVVAALQAVDAHSAAMKARLGG